MDSYLVRIKKELGNLTEGQKDALILHLASCFKNKDYVLQKMKEQKEVQDCPTQKEVDAFCARVAEGKFTVQLSEEGRIADLMGDFKAFPDLLLRCRQGVLLEDYSRTHKLYAKLIQIRIPIANQTGLYLDIRGAFEAGMRIFLDKFLLLSDMLKTAVAANRQDGKRARAVADILELDLYPGMNDLPGISRMFPDDLKKSLEKLPFVEALVSCLREDLAALDADPAAPRYSLTGDSPYRTRLTRLLDIFQPKYDDLVERNSPLHQMWNSIQSDMRKLSRMRYIDDPIELSHAWETIEDFVGSYDFHQESWKTRKKFIEDIVANDFYSNIDLTDPMEELVQALLLTEDERLTYANILERSGRTWSAVQLYKDLGYEEKYIAYFEEKIADGDGFKYDSWSYDKKPRPFQVVLDYYWDRDRERCLEYARQCVLKTSPDRTRAYYCLMQDAKERGDEETFQTLLSEVKRRRGTVDCNELQKEFPNENWVGNR